MSLEQEAYDLAIRLGCEIYTPEEGYTYWRHGRRSSADQYAKSFKTAQEAAAHFLTTREAQSALKKYMGEISDLVIRCRAAVEAGEAA